MSIIEAKSTTPYENSEAVESEVELISLTFEKLPKYRLRADCSIEFSGYQHSDFKRAEQPQPEVSELTIDQIRSTFDYFLLCGLRVNQMTETYEDPAAMRLLVQEQRSHMDLAATIGLNLVEKNSQLEARVTTLEESLECSKETILQLRHQLNLKDDLLRVYNDEIEQDLERSHSINNEIINISRIIDLTMNFHCDFNSISGSGDNPFCYMKLNSSTEPGTSYSSIDSSFSLDKINMEKLETKLQELGEENTKLKQKQSSINSCTEQLEQKEQNLVEGCIRQLIEVTKNTDRLNEELSKKNIEFINQHQEITRLLTAKIDMENKLHNLLSSNDSLTSQVRDYQTKQLTMAKELITLRDRYDECLNLLNEKQDQLRHYKRKYHRESMRNDNSGINFYKPNSDRVGGGGASSICTEMNLSDELMYNKKMENNNRTLKLMQQARNVNKLEESCISNISSGFCDETTSVSCTDNDGDLYEEDEDDDDDDDTIGSPNSTYLSGGGNYILRNSIKHDCNKRRIIKSHQLADDVDNKSISSSSSSNILYEINNSIVQDQQREQSLQRPNFVSSTPNPNYRKPEKLQLVKPMQGSQTLRAWQNLATPSITKALFEDQPSHSVCFRGQNQTGLSTCSSSASSTGPNSPIGHCNGISINSLGSNTNSDLLLSPRFLDSNDNNSTSHLISDSISEFSDDSVECDNPFVSSFVDAPHGSSNISLATRPVNNFVPLIVDATHDLSNTNLSTRPVNNASATHDNNISKVKPVHLNFRPNNTHRSNEMKLPGLMETIEKQQGQDLAQIFQDCNTPVNESKHFPVIHKSELMPPTSSASWISSLVTGILGTRTSSPPTYQGYHNSTLNDTTTTTTSSISAISSSSTMISKLTNLPPLAAVRRPPQFNQTAGLNLLSSTSNNNIVMNTNLTPVTTSSSESTCSNSYDDENDPLTALD